MSGLVEGRVAIVTGAGRGIGREHALSLASKGAKVVVNDLGGDMAGAGGDVTPAQSVVDEIAALGGEAVVNGSNVADFGQAEAMIHQAIDTFGGLDILINNAGILRDRMVFQMEESDPPIDLALDQQHIIANHDFIGSFWDNTDILFANREMGKLFLL